MAFSIPKELWQPTYFKGEDITFTSSWASAKFDKSMWMRNIVIFEKKIGYSIYGILPHSLKIYNFQVIKRKQNQGVASLSLSKNQSASLKVIRELKE